MPAWTPPTAEDIAAKEAVIAKDEEQFAAMKQNFEVLKQTLEENFEANLQNILTDKEKQELDEATPQEQFKLLNAKHKEIVESKLDEARAAIDDFEAGLYNSKLALENRRVDLKIAGENPDMDLEAFADWVQKDLTPRLQAELLQDAGNDKAKFVEALVARYKETLANTPPPTAEDTKKTDDELPTNLDDVAGESGNVDTNDGEDSNTNDDFLSKSGMYK